MVVNIQFMAHLFVSLQLRCRDTQILGSPNQRGTFPVCPWLRGYAFNGFAVVFVLSDLSGDALGMIYRSDMQERVSQVVQMRLCQAYRSLCTVDFIH